jgi:hypothetical protein
MTDTTWAAALPAGAIGFARGPNSQNGHPLTIGVTATGDSSVLYSRTESRPMSTIREHRVADFDHDEYRPIVGYYLASCSAASVDSLATTFYDHCLQSYYAVSIVPAAPVAAKTVWHGDVAPIVEVTWLDPRPRIRELAHSLFGSDEDSRRGNWYFMPGQWVTSRGGHARFKWTVKRGDEVVYTVRAERVSHRTLKGHAR